MFSGFWLFKIVDLLFGGTIKTSIFGVTHVILVLEHHGYLIGSDHSKNSKLNERILRDFKESKFSDVKIKLFVKFKVLNYCKIPL